MSFLSSLIRFSRLHTIVGTTLSITALYLLALGLSDFRQLFLDVFFLSLISCLGANVYIVGLNQLMDIEIDRINKPYLPLASGAFTYRQGIIIITVSVVVSLLLAFYLGGYLLLTVVLSLLLGTAYSLPPVRLKRFTFWAAFCIIAVRGLIVNLLLFLHFHSIINGSHELPPLIWLLTITIFVYSVVIAWFKDIPDMEGDSRFNIKTLTLRLGALAVFRMGNALLVLSCLAVILYALSFPLDLHRPILIGGHVLIPAGLWIAASRVDLDDRASVFSYYQFIWVLFFLEYIVFAAAGLY
ncbi:MAG: homogentisate phytyltransferase [Saprospiraceae bacterium]|nr:homogentisate phytyltransferase [Saprospiraceae bacterium]